MDSDADHARSEFLTIPTTLAENNLTTQTLTTASVPSASAMTPVHRLSGIIALLLIVANAGGILINGLYRDESSIIRLSWLINDSVTLALALPLLIGSLAASMRGSQRGTLVLLGVLEYTVYNYAFYIFGAAFNWFFLIYAALLALSIIGTVSIIRTIDIGAIGQSLSPNTPVRWVAGYMTFWGIGLSALWIMLWIVYMTTGVPPIAHLGAEGQKLTAALDLSLVIVPVFLGAYWLWKRNTWGLVLAVMLNIKSIIYTPVLAIGSFVLENNGVPGSSAQAPLWIFLFVASLLSILVLLVNLKPVKP